MAKSICKFIGISLIIFATNLGLAQSALDTDNKAVLVKYNQIYSMLQNSAKSPEVKQKAARMIAELQSDFPRSPYTFFALAEYKYLESLFSGWDGNNPEVIAIIEQGMRLAGPQVNIPDGYILKAKIAIAQGARSDAVSYANTAIQIAPNKPEALFAKARAEQVNAHYKEAEQFYRRCIDLQPDPRRKANIYYWLGNMLSSSERTMSARIADRHKAQEALRHAVALDPAPEKLRAYGQFLLFDMGDSAGARKFLDGTSILVYVDYLDWATHKTAVDPLVSLAALESKTGLAREDAFRWSAQYEGMAPVVLSLLRIKAIKNIDAADPRSLSDNPNCLCNPAIVNAAYAGNLKLLMALEKYGANINAEGGKRRTPLYFAAQNADIPMTSYLLSRGARINTVTADSWSPLIVAISERPESAKLVKLLLEHGADPLTSAYDGRPAPFRATYFPETLKVLVNEGKVDVKMKDAHGVSLLVASIDTPESMRFLLVKGASPWGRYKGVDLVSFMEARASRFPEYKHSVDLLIAARKTYPRDEP